MSTKYERLKKDFCIGRIRAKIHNPILIARKRYKIKNRRVQRVDELEKLAADFYSYIFNTHIGTDVPMPFDIAQGNVKKLLGLSNNYVRYWNSAKNSFDAGIPALLDEITNKFIEQQTGRYVDSVIEEHIVGQSYEVTFGLMSEFIRDNERWLPDEFCDANMLCHYYREVLHGFIKAQFQTSAQMTR